MDIDSKKWLSLIPDETSIKSINIPATHDSATRFCQFSLISRCQYKSIPSQLSIGVRALDLRVDGENMVHSFAKCKTSSGKILTIYRVIDNIYEFLEDNPTETVIVFFKNDGKTPGEECLKILIEDVISKNKDKWYLENRLPTLGEVRGKVILANRINSSVGLDFSKMPYQGNSKSGEAEAFSICSEDKAVIQDYCTLMASAKWNAVFSVLENDFKKSLVLNYLSTSGFPFIPKINARKINEQFKSYKLINGKYYGIIMADFIDTKLSKLILQSNF